MSEILFLSAATRADLVRKAREIAGGAPGDLAPRLARMPVAGPHRLVLLAADTGELRGRVERAIVALEGAAKPRMNLSNAVFYGDLDAEPAGTGAIAVLFPGFGARDLSVCDALIARPRIAAAFAKLAGASSKRKRRGGGHADGTWPHLEGILRADLALWALLSEMKISPDTMLGHSLGEQAALVAAGRVASLGDASTVLATIAGASRDARADNSLGMIAVTSASRALVDARVSETPSLLAIALDNCPQQLVVWGVTEALAALAAEIRARGEIVFPISDLTWPVHTPFFPMDDAALDSAFADLALRTGDARMWSAATAAPLPNDAGATRAMLAAGWRQPVRFRESLLSLHDAGVRTFIEAGPGGRLAGFARDTLRGRPFTAVPMHAEGQPVWRQLGIALGTLFTRGVAMDPSALYEDGPLAGALAEPLPVTARAASASPNQSAASADSILTRVLREVAALLDIDDPESIAPDRGLFDLGLTSIMAVELAANLEAAFDRRLADTVAFDHPTPRALADHLSGAARSTATQAVGIARPGDVHEPIAIVGMSCRLPGGVTSPDEFWQLLAAGVDGVGRVPADRWDPTAFEHYLEPPDRPRALHGAFLDEIRGFDPAFFGISPREATSLDPQQRLLLELAWEALENGAIDPSGLAASPTGVFIGLSSGDYAQRLTPRERLAARGYLGTGNAASTAAGRLSFFLGLRGPTLTIDTACSSSLVALHLACQSLRRGEVSTAFAGGVNLLINPETTVFLANAQALSPSGRCHTFDAAADGYVRAEGGGLVVLKRLADAQRDHNRILAVVRGTATNHSGRTSGLTVPSGPAERAVVVSALADAGVAPAEIGYLEAHGTGTALGDPIEVQALGGVFADVASRPIPIGSVKTNVGHLEAAAGITGLIKVVLQLQHQQIAPSLHFETANPRVDWSKSPVEVVTSLRTWPGDQPRIAGVSSFGISGTNAHAIVEEAPRQSRTPQVPATQVLTLSAPTASALPKIAERLAGHLAANPSISLADVAQTLGTGRRAFRHRHTIVARDLEDAQRQWAALAGDGRSIAAIGRSAPKLAMLFTGQGAQSAGMGELLERHEPAYRGALLRVVDIARQLTPKNAPSLIDVMHGVPAGAIDSTMWTQPALFACEFALAELWASRGVRPDAVIGHSVGEYVAAVVAGVMTLEDGFRLLWRRAELMQSLPAGGGMLAIRATEDEVAELLRSISSTLVIAAINGQTNVVVSGPVTEIERARAACDARGVKGAPLNVSHAFHSPLMDPILGEMNSAAAKVAFSPPRVPVFSNLTGAMATEAGLELQTADYWTQQLRQPVRFAAGLDAALDAGITVFLEVGPRPVLTGLGRQIAGRRPVHWLTSLMPGVDDDGQIASATAALVDAGVPIDWAGVSGLRGARRIPLPTYPFERTPYWIRSSLTAASAGAADARQLGRLLGARADQPADGDKIRFEAELYPGALEELVESRVLNRAVVPASGFLLMGTRLARALGHDAPITIAGLSIETPLAVPAQGTRVQTLAEPIDESCWRARVFSRSDATQWTPHGSFVVIPGAADPPPAAPKRKGAAIATLDGDEFYRRSARLGIEYGPRTQWLTRLEFYADRCEATAEGKASVDALPLPWLDAVFQAAGAACFTATGKAVIGVRHIEMTRLFASLAGSDTRARISVVADDALWDQMSAIVTDDRDGRVIATFDGISCEHRAIDDVDVGPAIAPSAVSSGADQGTIAAYLDKTLAAVLRVPPGADVDHSALFSEMGVDSLMAMYVSTLIEQRWGVSIPATRMIEGGSIESLTADIIHERQACAGAMDAGRRIAADMSDPTAAGPLSDGQRALWFLWRLARDSTAYNQSLPLKVSGTARTEAWRHACDMLSARHAILRTVYESVDGDPTQRVEPVSAIDWQVIDARGIGEADFTRMLAASHGEPFDLSARPPVRYRWFDRGETPPVLLITMHHIACDGWSLELIRRELPRLAAGTASTAPPATTYRDFVRWQADMLGGARGEELWAFWRDTLAAPRPILDLPTDRVRPAVPTYAGDIVECDLPPGVVTNLRALAAREGVTLFAMFLSLYSAVLSKWSGQREMIIGAPTAGRTRPEFNSVVGYFVDPLAIRLRVPAGGSWRVWLQDVKRAALDALAHRDFPFARLVERLRAERDPGRSPLFDVTFNYNGRGLADHAVPVGGHAGIEAFDIPQAAGKFDLTLSVTEDDRTIRMSLGYRSDLFDRKTIDDVAAWLLHAAGALAADAESAVRDVCINHSLVPAIAGRRTGTATLRPVLSTILDRCAQSPADVALVAENGRITYGELLTAASGLAGAITAVPGGEPRVVGILTGRTTHFIVSMLAAWRAGAAFVPLDPADPPPLIAARLQKSGATVIVCDKDRESQAGTFGLRTIRGDVANPAPASHDAEPALSDMAYVLFTSGSTGEPKAVAVPHRALANYVESIATDLALAPKSSFGFISSMTADLGHTSIFPALATGGTLHVLPDRAATIPSAFADYLAAEPLDYLKIVPSHFVALAGGASDAWPLPRRALIFGGESTPRAVAARVVDAGCRVFNHYGPTETTVGVLTHAVESLTHATLPLSRAVNNCDIYLLDEERRPVPRGWPGEVHIAGAPLAIGYLADPGQTGARFVTLPNGVRAYRTGDLARQLADDSILLIGRADDQINLHGYRIEPGQIEAALAEVPGVRQHAVLTDVDGSSAALLAAWVVADVQSRLTEAEIRAALAARLPRHMVPARIFLVDAIPVTSNGKRDTRAMRAMLTAPAAEGLPARVVDVTEWRLLQLWRDVLGVPALGPQDDFFSAGGHSLLAVRLAGHIADAFGVDVPLTTFFTHRTPSEMARVLREGGASLPVLTPMAAGDAAAAPILCIPGAGGSILYFNDFVRALGTNGAVWGAQALSDPIPETVEETAARYIALTAGTATAAAAWHLIGHSFGGLVAFEMARQLRAAGAKVGPVVILDNVAPGIDAAAAAESRDDAGWLRHIALRIGKLHDAPLEISAAEAASPDAVDHLIGAMRKIGAIAADVRTDQFRRYIEIYKKNARAAGLYRPPTGAIDVDIILCRATDRDAALALHETTDAALGWQAFTTRPVQVRVVPGTHITMLNVPNVRTLADTVRAALFEDNRQ